MPRHDSAEPQATESGDLLPPITARSGELVVGSVSHEDLVAFLDQNLEHDKTHLILTSIKGDPALRQQAVALQSTWNLLDLLPTEEPSTRAAQQAARIIQAESRRHRWRSLGLKSAAFLLSLVCVWSAWLFGNSSIRPGRVALAGSIYKLNLLDLLVVAGDTDFFNLLLSDPHAEVFAKLCRLTPVDDSLILQKKIAVPDGLRAWESLEARRQLFQALPANRQAAVAAMADQIMQTPESEQFEAFRRFTGLRIFYDSIPDDERQKFDQLSGQARWSRAVKGAEMLARQKEGTRKQAFTVNELNRPDFIMDLATLTASWMKMSPQEKNAFERRSRNTKNAILSKTDRLRQLAQSLENMPEGAFPALEALKNNPPPRLASKFDSLKQQREKKRSEYLETIRKAGPMTTDPTTLQAFLANLPPWLVDLIDPLPPSEARRLLGILKILVDQNVSTPTRRPASGE